MSEMLTQQEAESIILHHYGQAKQEIQAVQELIDRQALIKDMCNNKTEAKCPCYPNCYPCDFSEARRIIDIQPTIEPEVRHGRWNYRHEDDWCYCTACGTDAEGSDGYCLETDYCPHCGARMDGGADNG